MNSHHHPPRSICASCSRMPKPLLEAASNGHSPCIVACLRKPGLFDAPVRDDFGATALHLASRRGQLEALRYLVEYGEAAESVRANNGASPAHDAAATGNLACLRYLVAHTACSAHDRDNNRATPIHWATQMGHLDVVQWLVEEAGARLDDRTKSGVTPIHFAAAKNQLKVLEYLAETGEYDLVNATASNGATPAYFAAQEGHLPCLRYLVGKCRADASLRANDGMTCLHAAAQEGHLDCVRWLINLGGCRVRARAGDGATATHYAASQGHLHVLQWLIESAGSTGIEQDNYGGTPGHDAAEQGQLRVLEFLAERDISLMLSDKDGNTPLELAENNGHRKCAEFLKVREREEQAAGFRPRELRRRNSSRASSIKVEEWVEETRQEEATREAANQLPSMSPIDPEAKRQWEEMQAMIEEEQRRSRKMGSVKNQRWVQNEQLRIADAARERRRRQDMEASLRTARMEVERIEQRQQYENEPSSYVSIAGLAEENDDDKYRREEEKRRRYRLLREQEERVIKRKEEEEAKKRAIEAKKRKDEEDRQRILKERQEFWLVEMQKKNEEERKVVGLKKDAEKKRQEEKERKKREEEKRRKEEETGKRNRKEEEQRRKRLRKEEKEKEKAREKAQKEQEKMLKKLEKKKRERGEYDPYSRTPEKQPKTAVGHAVEETSPPLSGLVRKRTKEFEKRHAESMKSSFSLFRRNRKQVKAKPAIEGKSGKIPSAPPLQSTPMGTPLVDKQKEKSLSTSSSSSSKANSRRSSVTDMLLPSNNSTPSKLVKPNSNQTADSPLAASLSKALKAAHSSTEKVSSSPKRQMPPPASSTITQQLPVINADEMRQTTSPAAMMAALERALAASPNNPTAAAQKAGDGDVPQLQEKSDAGKDQDGRDLMEEIVRTSGMALHLNEDDDDDEMVEITPKILGTVKVASVLAKEESVQKAATSPVDDIPVAPQLPTEHLMTGSKGINTTRFSLDPIEEGDETEG